MPTVITHAAVPLCIGLGLGSKAIPPRLLFAGIILAMLPDADVLSFKFGVAYGNVFGHRGFTHSLVFAFVVPLLCVLIGRRWFRAGLIRCWLFFDAPRDKCTLSCAINGIHAAFHYLKKNYISGCVMTVPTG